MPDVVCADHENNAFGRIAVRFAVVQTPQNVFRAVAAESEVNDVFVGVTFRPNAFALVFPVVGNGVSVMKSSR